ncbi:MAG: replication factor C large subunit [Candidatus Aenigmarchaeota archaeon]|nr:replication factor C large subunit [Candidatus Aenigmarchaeota archaeon]
MWIYEYAPKKVDELSGNSKAIEDILSWVKNYKSQPKKALIIEGPPGTAKTTAIELIAKELGLNIVYSSAADTRTQKALSETFGASLAQQSLFYKGKLVVFDEIDALSGRNDRGAAGEIVKIIKASKHPIILLANDLSAKKLAPIKKEAKIIKFSKIPTPVIALALSKILNAEKISYDERALSAIARQADGDIRAAINDLEILSRGEKELSYESIKKSGYRDLKKPLQEILTIIFKTQSAKNAKEAIDLANEPLDNIIEWIRENIPREYKKAEDRAKAYDMLSRANIFMGRIHTRQYWRYLVYAYALASLGVATAKKEKYPGILSYHYPTKISLLGASMFSRAKKDALAKKLSPHLHCSKKDAIKYFNLLGLIEQNQPAAWAGICEKADI